MHIMHIDTYYTVIITSGTLQTFIIVLMAAYMKFSAHEMRLSFLQSFISEVLMFIRHFSRLLWKGPCLVDCEENN